LPSVPDLDADRLHRTAVEAFRLGNRGRLALCEVLRALHVSRMFFDLGYPTIQAYAERFFGFGRTETFEAIRVVRALDELPECRAAFLEGRMDWSSLKEITRVAKAATEGEWLEFASKHNTARLRAEAQDAVEKRRDRPREERFGLPNMKIHVVLKLTQSEHEILRKGLGALVPDLSRRIGGGEVELRDVLLYLANRFLTDGVEAMAPKAAPQRGEPGRERERLDPARTVLYHTCPDCRGSRMATGNGWVAVAPEEVERIEGQARREEIDGPTPPALRRKVLLRDGARCSNPWCDSPADHCHHILQRSRGGRTAIWNETALCARCHALVHAGLLRVLGDLDAGLEWSGRADGIRVDLREERARAAKLPPIVVQGADADAGGNGAASRHPDSVATDWSYLAKGLVRLGLPGSEAGGWIERAVRTLMARNRPTGGHGVLTEADILTEALRARGGPMT